MIGLLEKGCDDGHIKLIGLSLQSVSYNPLRSLPERLRKDRIPCLLRYLGHLTVRHQERALVLLLRSRHLRRRSCKERRECAVRGSDGDGGNEP